MQLFEAIRKRHSYRGGYTDQLVTRDDLCKIVEAGIRAPSGYNAQTTRFVIVNEADLLQAIAAHNPASTVLNQCKALIACIAPKEPAADSDRADRNRLFFGIEDCSAAVENMLLAITALGYASVWLDGWLRREGRAEAIGQLLRVPSSHVVRVLLPIGLPAEERPQAPKKPFAERAWFNRYGGQDT